MHIEPILIKKYPNRRLYDTRVSRYITQDELAALVVAGATVRVVDARSGEDRTRPVLLQVLLDGDQPLDLLPIELLHHLVRIRGTVQAGPFGQFLGQAFRQFEQAARVLPALDPTGWWRGFARGGEGASTAPAAEPPTGDAAVGPPGDRGSPEIHAVPAEPLAELRERIERLRRRLSG